MVRLVLMGKLVHVAPLSLLTSSCDGVPASQQNLCIWLNLRVTLLRPEQSMVGEVMELFNVPEIPAPCVKASALNMAEPLATEGKFWDESAEQALEENLQADLELSTPSFSDSVQKLLRPWMRQVEQERQQARQMWVRSEALMHKLNLYRKQPRLKTWLSTGRIYAHTYQRSFW